MSLLEETQQRTMHNANAPLMGGTFRVLKGGRISGPDRENSSYKFPQL